MGAGCSTEKAGAPGALKQSSSENARASSQKRKEELLSRAVAEFPNDDPEDLPNYADGSREATFVKVFVLLDKSNCGALQVSQMKDYVLEAGLPIEDFAKELAVIVSEQGALGDPKVSARQFVTALTRMVKDFDNPSFAYFIAQTLQTHRAKGGSQKKLAVEVTNDEVTEGVEGAVASPR